MEPGFQHSEQRAALVDAVEASLRPLMPLFLNYGVTHHDLTEMLARVFVTAIGEQLKKEGRPTTVARLALSTGINRSRVEKIVADRDAASARRAFATQNTSALALVLATWHDDPRFSTPYGVPLDLEVAQAEGRRSFVDLVGVAIPVLILTSLWTNSSPRAALRCMSKGFLRCTDRAYIPAGIDKSQIVRLGQRAAALARTFTHNLLNENRSDPLFERQVDTDYPVSDDGRHVIQRYLETEGQSFLVTLDQWLTGRHDQLRSDSGKRFGISIFAYEVENEPAEGAQRAQSVA